MKILLDIIRKDKSPSFFRERRQSHGTNFRDFFGRHYVLKWALGRLESGDMYSRTYCSACTQETSLLLRRYLLFQISGCNCHIPSHFLWFEFTICEMRCLNCHYRNIMLNWHSLLLSCRLFLSVILCLLCLLCFSVRIIFHDRW